MKTCQKMNCINKAITRGKFCEIHRTNKRNIIPPQISEHTINNISSQNLFEEERKQEQDISYQNLLEEERKLKQEQDISYQNTLIQDRLRIEENEYNNILKLSLDQFYIDKKNKLQSEPINGDFYFIKIKIPNGNILSRKFNINSKIEDIRDYLDIYFYENGINIQNYNIVFTIPFKKIGIEYNNLFIKDITNQNKFIIHINNIDA
jgi:hypothetical protein